LNTTHKLWTNWPPAGGANNLQRTAGVTERSAGATNRGDQARTVREIVRAAYVEVMATARLSCVLWLAAMSGCSPSAGAADTRAAEAHSEPAHAVPQPQVDYKLAPERYVSPSPPIGVNLAAVNYYATAIPFVDVWNMADPFQSTDAPNTQGSGRWDTGLADRIPRDAQGYPLEAPTHMADANAPQVLRAAVVSLLYAGRYVVLYDGDGELDFPSSAVRVVSRTPGRIELEVPSAPEQTLFLSIVRSKRGDHVRNLRVILPGFEASYAQQPFHPHFLARLAGVGALRFMDWGATNQHAHARWSERTRPEGAQGGERGVAYEHMIDLANRVGADAWFCVPHRADDGYVRALAELIKTRLAPERRAFIEYSNELWNGIFEQTHYVQQRGCEAGLNKLGQYTGRCQDAGVRLWAGVKWNARRSGQIFHIFDDVFGKQSDRITHIIAGQAQNPHLNEVLLQALADARINTARTRADALAIAPYLGGALALARAMEVPQLLEQLEQLIPSEVSEPTQKNRSLAQHHHLELIAYEAGQHLRVDPSHAEDAGALSTLIRANRDPRMRSIYAHMFDAWYAHSDRGLLMLFNYAERPSKFGAWGLLEDQEQPDSAAPKYQAFIERLQHLKVDAILPDSQATHPPASPRLN